METEKRKGNRDRLLGLIPALLLAVLAAGLLLTPKSEPDGELADRTAEAAEPYLVEEESFFSDFEVVDDHVYFLCRLTVRNPSETPLPVKISGDFSADAGSGLILGQGLPALRLDGGTGADFLALDAAEQETVVRDRSRLLFLLQPGDNVFWVVFSGLHGESSVKQDRLLPKIHLSPLVDVTPEEVSAAMDCRIFKDPNLCDAYLLDGEEIYALGTGFGGYGFTSAVPFDYGFNEVPDLLFTYSWGSGFHRSHLALFDRTTKEERELYVYYPYGAERDLLVELEPDGYPAVVYTADVTANGYDFSDLRFTKREKAGTVVFVLAEDEALSGPRFVPDEDFLDLYYMPEAAPELGTMEAGEDLDASDGQAEGNESYVIQLPDARPWGCHVSYGCVRMELDSETAEELFRICLEAEAQESAIRTFDDSKELEQPALSLCFRFWAEEHGAMWEGPWLSVREDDSCMKGASIYASYAQECQLPAGTYDALMAVLTRDGALSASPGERVEGSEVYALFERDGLYTVQLYDRGGALVWAYGPGNRRPEVKQEEPGLWSVSVQAGTGIGTRWTVYYAPEEGRISRAWYGVLAQQGELLAFPVSGSGLRVCELFSDGFSGPILTSSQPLAPAAEPFVSAHFTEDGKAVVVTYLAGEDYHEVTETIPLP